MVLFNNLISPLLIIFRYKFPIPKNYNKILKKIYNNYMTHPPKEKQKPRHNINKIKI